MACRTLRPIVFAVDESYLTPLRVAIESLRRACESDVGALRVIVLHEGIDESVRRSLGLGHHIEWREISLPSHISLPLREWLSRAAYYRLAIAEALLEYDSCLYLDADILVLESVADLLTRPLTASPVAAIRDPSNPTLGSGPALPCWRELRLAENREYFNSGVMLLDLAECRDRKLFERAWEFIQTCPECIHYCDQDALNRVVDDDWERLDHRWNTFADPALVRSSREQAFVEAMNEVGDLDADGSTAWILHFAGPSKPWRPGFSEGRARDSYVEVLRRLQS